MSKESVNVGVVGVGGWGKNLARNYSQIPEAQLRYLCDLDEAKLKAVRSQFQAELTTTRFDDLIEDPELQAIVIATTGPTHYELCKKALLAGKDVYVEKPFVLSVADAEEIVSLADDRQRILMVGHLLEYHPVVQKLKEMIDSGELGKIRYIYSQRLNLGTVRMDENALWNFAPHDISVILYLLGLSPTDVSARGQSYLREGIEDVVFLTLNFGGKAMGHVHVSWLDPHKTRRITIVGSQRMAVFDDLDANEKLKIYDKGAQVNMDYDTFAEYVGLRFGDITVPYIRVGEPLRVECEHFLDCVRERKTPLSDGQDGLRVVKVLEAANRSLAVNGSPVSIDALQS
ncbi:MAG: Gfo/Idh/MocA family protein [Nitrososphaera sp.]